MKLWKPMRKWAMALLVVAVSLVSAPRAQARSRYTVMHRFDTATDGSAPFAGLILDRAGDLYGTTWGGGGTGAFGVVFELLPLPDGGWAEGVLHRFDPKVEGGGPFAGLTLDAAGNFYGTTSTGGSQDGGTVFRLEAGSGGWTLTVLDNYGSNAGLILDEVGNLYGNIGPGRYDEGAVTELVHGSQGWAQSYLYSFCRNINPCLDGDAPISGVVLDRAGNLYGTTEYGGKGTGGDWGTAYELQHQADGTWKHILLHSFPGSANDGKLVYGGLILDKSGNLYGTTLQGGGKGCGEGTGCGTVYKLTHTAKGWKETVLYNFANPKNGAGPSSSLTFDAFGNLWGTAGGGTGPCNGGCGVVFKMTPGSNGKWDYAAVHHFTGNDGAYPNASVVFDGKGNLYGTTELGGGGNSVGVVFEITP
jgi:uncharacterized repeat protein (TIGR03803 family)